MTSPYAVEYSDNAYAQFAVIVERSRLAIEARLDIERLQDHLAANGTAGALPTHGTLCLLVGRALKLYVSETDSRPGVVVIEHMEELTTDADDTLPPMVT